MQKLMIAAALLISMALMGGNALAVQTPPAPTPTPTTVIPKKIMPPPKENDDTEGPVRRKPLRFHHVPKPKCKVGIKPIMGVKPIKGVCRPQSK